MFERYISSIHLPQGRIIRRCWRSCHRVTGYRVQIAAPQTSTALWWNAGTRRLPNGPRSTPFTVSWTISTPESTSKPLRCRRGGLKGTEGRVKKRFAWTTVQIRKTLFLIACVNKVMCNNKCLLKSIKDSMRVEERNGTCKRGNVHHLNLTGPDYL